jgi:hypothetical protein
MEIKGIYRGGLKVAVHSASCVRLNTENRKRGIVVITAAEIEDMRARGFKIVTCPCARG